MFCCLRPCLNGFVGTPTAAKQMREPDIHMDSSHMGSDVVLLCNQLRITGSGGALGSAPLVQSKSYFEVKIQHNGLWSIGLATSAADLNRKFGGLDKESWCLCSDSVTRHNNEDFHLLAAAPITKEPAANMMDNGCSTLDTELLRIGDAVNNGGVLKAGTDILPMSLDLPGEPHSFPDEGDIVGVAYDHIELNFYFNGRNLDAPFRNVKGTVYPAIYVDSGAVLDIILDNFTYGPPPGFDRIMLEQSLL